MTTPIFTATAGQDGTLTIHEKYDTWDATYTLFAPDHDDFPAWELVETEGDVVDMSRVRVGLVVRLLSKAGADPQLLAAVEDACRSAVQVAANQAADLLIAGDFDAGAKLVARAVRFKSQTDEAFPAKSAR